MKKLTFHPLCEIFPVMPDAELSELAADIKANGLRQPILLLDGRIIDGRNRYLACKQAGVAPKFQKFKGDAAKLVKSLNLHRRHLDTSQRAMIAAHFTGLGEGRPNNSANLQSLSAEQAAAKFNVSTRSVSDATKVKEDGSSALQKAVMAGEVSVSKAASVTDLPKGKQLAAAKGARDFSNVYTSGAATQQANGVQVRRDKVGREIPAEILAEWDRAHEVGTKLRSIVSAVKCELQKGIESERDIIFRELSNSIISDAEALHYSLSQILPHAVCPKCQGKTNRDCLMCRQRGFISKFYWDGPAVGNDLRTIITKQYGSAFLSA